MDPIPPTLPFHLAKAYGVKPGGAAHKATPALTVTPIAPGVDRVDGVRATDLTTATDRAVKADRAELGAAKKSKTIAEKLVAAVVPGGVEFQNGVALARPAEPDRPATAPIPFYRHPADKNAAATAIGLGNRLDLEG